jgi:hypothetical protein
VWQKETFSTVSNSFSSSDAITSRDHWHLWIYIYIYVCVCVCVCV